MWAEDGQNPRPIPGAGQRTVIERLRQVRALWGATPAKVHRSHPITILTLTEALAARCRLLPGAGESYVSGNIHYGKA